MTFEEFSLNEIQGLKIRSLSIDTQPTQKAVILLHGYGASCQDLAPLSQELAGALTESVDWFFPNGIISVPISPWMEGRGWFPLDAGYFTLPSHDIRDWTPSESMKTGFDHASTEVARFLKTLKTRYSSVVLGGFSQGAMVALDLIFHHSIHVNQLLILSGAWVPNRGWFQEKPSSPKPIQVFQSHGKNDPVLSFAAAEELSKEISQQVKEFEFYPFEGAHEIPLSIIENLRRFLKEPK